MSLDGGFLHIVKTEILQRIPIGARIDKIQQPSRDEIVLTFRVAGVCERLLFSANAMSARVCIVSSPRAAGIAPGEGNTVNQPPLFCLTLRKHIGNGRLAAITQDGLERVLNLDFAATNEIGDAVNMRLIIEIMGRISNIILINADNGRIVDGIKRVTDEISRTRRILPNLEYLPPQKDENRLCLLDCDIDNADWEMNDKALLKQLEGVSPIFAREAVYCANGCAESLKAYLREAKAALIGENVKPKITLISDLDGTPRDFCFVPVTQYGTEKLISSCESANELLDTFYKEKAGTERLKQRSGNIMKTLNTSYERLLRKIENQKLELSECQKRDELRIFGDLINANMYTIQSGDSFLEAENYVTGERVKIKLDTRLSPAQNAQKYYAAYRKLSTAEKMLTTLIEDGKRELLYLESVIDAASRAASDAEIGEILVEIKGLSRSGKPSKSSQKQNKVKPLSPLKFTASDGTEILVGRNNKQNNQLTFKTARPDDIWLHTKDIAGSHTILRCSGGTPSEESITEAAIIAAEHSKGRDSSRVPVDYTFAKFVKKPSGSKPGYVIFTHNKTIYVNPKKP